MALLGKEKYTPQEVERIYDYLSVYHEKEQPIQFEIIVDNFKAVRRTDDLSMFHVFDKFIKPNTKSVEFILYTGNSNNNDKYMLFFGEDEQRGLSGLEVEKRIQEGIDKEKRGWEFDQLRAENKTLKQELQDQEKELDSLEKELERMEAEKEALIARQSPLKGLVGELGAGIIEAVVRRNPKTIAQFIPGGETLAGLLDQEAKEREQDSIPQDAEIIFTPKGSADSSHTEQDKETLQLLNQLRKAFSEQQYDMVLEILDALLNDKTKISLVHEMLH